MKITPLIFLLFITTAFLAEANFVDFKQERPKSKGKFGVNQAPTSSFSSQNRTAQKVDKLAEKIISTLELNEAEAKTIHDLCENRAEKIEKIKLNSDNSQQKIIDLQSVNQVFDSRIKQLVSPSQYQKYEALRKNGN
jgi:hypothetical protein